MAQRLLWLGMLVVVVDLPLNRFDVLPDAVGWAMVLLALFDLRRLHRRFTTALAVAVAGLVTSSFHQALFFSEKSYPGIASVVEVVESLSWWLLVWCVLWALADLVAADRRLSLATRRLLVVLLAVGTSEVLVRLLVAVLVVGRGRLPASQGWLQTLARGGLFVAGGAAALWVAHCGARRPVREAVVPQPPARRVSR